MSHSQSIKRIHPSVMAAFMAVLVMAYVMLLNVSSAMAESPFVPGELLIQFHAGMSAEKAKGLLNAHGATTIDENIPIRVRRIKVPEHALDNVKAALEKNPNVSFVENNFLAEGGMVPNDIKYVSQWHLPKISAPAGWDINTGLTTEPIAIIDSGVDPAHLDLAGKLIGGYNFLSGNTDTHDVLGHGTAVAGTAAAGSNNSIGVAGVAWKNPIMPLVVLDSSDYASYSNIAHAITYAVDMGVRVINISIGGSSSSSTLQSAVDYAWNNGALVIACAHNYATSTPYYPAACNHAIAVSATTSSDTLASFSNFGSWIDISAPGTSIVTTTNGGGYGTWQGTSFSSPLVAGLAALILSVNPQLTNTDVANILTRNADDLGTAGFDTFFGYGRINVGKALVAAQNAVVQTDTSAPSVSITAPSTGSIVKGNVTVSVSATDNTGVTSVELYADNALLGISTAYPYQFIWDTTACSEGTHTLKAVAKDAAGNQATSSTVTLTVQNVALTPDTTAPVVKITSLSGGATITGLVIITASAIDNVKVTKMELYIDGKLTASTTKASLSYNWNTKKVSTGTHTILVKAYDAATNVGSVTVSVVK